MSSIEQEQALEQALNYLAYLNESMEGSKNVGRMVILSKIIQKTKNELLALGLCPWPPFKLKPYNRKTARGNS